METGSFIPVPFSQKIPVLVPLKLGAGLTVSQIVSLTWKLMWKLTRESFYQIFAMTSSSGSKFDFTIGIFLGGASQVWK